MATGTGIVLLGVRDREDMFEEMSCADSAGEGRS